MLWCLFVAISIVKYELVILNKLCDAIDFNLRFVNLYSWIKTTHCIYFSCSSFFFKEWSFSHTYANVHRGWADMFKSASDLFSLFWNHLVEVIVTDFSSSRSLLLPILFLFFHFFHFCSPFFSLLLHFLYVVKHIVRPARFLWRVHYLI